MYLQVCINMFDILSLFWLHCLFGLNRLEPHWGGVLMTSASPAFVPSFTYFTIIFAIRPNNHTQTQFKRHWKKEKLAPLPDDRIWLLFVNFQDLARPAAPLYGRVTYLHMRRHRVRDNLFDVSMFKNHSKGCSKPLCGYVSEWVSE